MGALNSSEARALSLRARVAARRLLDKSRYQRRARRAARIAAGLPKPTVTETHTNLGPMMDAIITRATANQLPYGVDADYDLVREHFDPTHFMLQATVLHEQPSVDPIDFFIRRGKDAAQNPEPNFSMGNYLARHPERATGEFTPYLHWLKRGRAAGEIADPAHGIERVSPLLGMTPAEVVREVVATREDMTERLRFGKLGEMFAKAAEVEPLIGAAWSETARVRIIPLGAQHVVGQMTAIHRLQEQADFKRARLVFVTNRPRWGGGRRLEGHLAHALDGTIAPEDVVVIYTDQSGRTPASRFPAGVRELDFFAATRSMPIQHREQALISLLRSFHADAIVNINSDLFYKALTPYGKALAASDRIFLTFLCNERRAQGNWEGWSLTWFYSGFEFVSGILTDSEYMRDQIAESYLLPEADRERIHVMRAPVEPELAPAQAPAAAPGRRPVVAWAGRLDRQKRIDLALDIARLMPDVDFRLWGERVLQGDPVGVVPGNVTLTDPYRHISDLDLSQVDAWLYTSAWDGVPSLLLEVAMTEVPLVATQVGGVGEVLSAEESWLVGADEDAETYVKALREILADPASARRRSHALRERLLGERSHQAYGADAAGLLLSQPARADLHVPGSVAPLQATADRRVAAETTDLTLIVTAHNETVVAGPTMRAADLAVEEARRRGFTVQTIIALDAATAQTTAYFSQPRFDHWERRVMGEGDLGRVRNALVPDTRGDFIAFLDADDVFSENWLADGLTMLREGEARGERWIAHPELNVMFDRNRAASRNVDQRSPLFTPHYLYVRNYYDSLCLTPREAHLQVPYIHRDIPNGLSFQDFQFGIETMSRGWTHVVVKDTIIFKRRRDFSLVVESNSRRAIVRSLPEMAIDRVRDLGKPHSTPTSL